MKGFTQLSCAYAIIMSLYSWCDEQVKICTRRMWILIQWRLRLTAKKAVDPAVIVQIQLERSQYETVETSQSFMSGNFSSVSVWCYHKGPVLFPGPGRPGQAQPFFFDDRPGPAMLVSVLFRGPGRPKVGPAVIGHTHVPRFSCLQKWRRQAICKVKWLLLVNY